MRSASPKLCIDAAATRMLPCTAMRMPNWPTISEKVAPRMKAPARPKAMMMRAFSPYICDRRRSRRRDPDAGEQDEDQDGDERQDGPQLAGSDTHRRHP